MKKSNLVTSESKLEKYLGNRWWRICNLYHIIDKNGNKVRFKPNAVQQTLYNNRWYRNIILKSRQHGITTFICLLFLDACLFEKNKTAAIIAHTIPDAQKIFETKIKYAYDNLPVEIRNNIKADTDRAGELRFSNNSSISVSTSTRSRTMNYLHVCLSGDTDILTKDANAQKIKNIKPGDKVLTSKGSYQKVKKLVKNKLSDIGEKMFAIETFGYYEPLKLTGNHKVMCREPKANGKASSGKPVWKKAADIQKGDYIAYPVRNQISNTRDGKIKVLDKRIELNFDLGYLTGMYLAEGTYRRGCRLTFLLHCDEVADFIKLVGKFSDYYSSYNVYCSKDFKTAVVNVYGKYLVEFFSRYFTKNNDKIIPDAVYAYGYDFVKGLIKGYFSGDECYKNINEISASSTRKQLIYQMRHLLITLRIGYPSIYYKENKDYEETWTIKLHGTSNWEFRKKYNLELPSIVPISRKKWRRGEKLYWSQVTNVKEINDEKYVYDIVLENSPHDYVTVNGVVHNSELGIISMKYPDKAKEIKTGAIPSVHKGNIIFIESTADGGASGEFYQFCIEAENKQRMGKRLSELDFKLHFFPWYADDNNRVNPEGIIINDRLKGYFDELETKRDIHLDDEQKAWYIVNEGIFKSDMWVQYPSYPEEAFKSAMDGAYYREQFIKIRDEKRICKVPYQDGILVNTAWDIGMNDATAIWFYQEVGKEIHLIDFYWNTGYGLGHYADILRNKHYRYGMHVGPHDLMIKQIANNALTRLESARQLGIEFRVCPRTRISEGIEIARNLLSICYFDEEKCADGIKMLEEYRKTWDDRNGVFRDQPLHDKSSDGADAFRYLAVYHKLMQNRTKKSEERSYSKQENYKYI